MRPVGSSGLRRRAAGLVLTCVALAGSSTFADSGPVAELNDGVAAGPAFDAGTLLGSARVPLNGAPDQAAANVLHVARNQVGDRYQWGGNGPDAWDCSGLTSLWKSVGGASGMPRVSRDQQAWAIPIPEAQVKRGDLVFFGHPVTHVGIVSGDGYMVDAAESRKGVVERVIWKSGVVRYGRVPRPGMPKVTPWTPPPLPSPRPAAPVADSPAAAAPVANQPKPAPKPGSKSQPLSKPKPVVKAKPVVKPAPKPAPNAAPRPAPKPTLKPIPKLPVLKGLPAQQKSLSSLVAYKAAAAARTVEGRPVGAKAWNDVKLVRDSWRHAGGGLLPADRAALVKRGKAVKLADARIGDVVVYSTPDTPHLGIYLGKGLMIDASDRLGRVVIRPVYAAGTARLIRLG